MKALKIVGGLFLVLIVAAVIVTVVTLRNLDQIIKAAVEEVGPQITGTEVRLNEVNLDLQNGRGELKGLTIANPTGFSSDNALDLGLVALQIEPSSITQPVKVINEVTISDIQLLAELKGLTETNLQRLQKQVAENTASSNQPAAQPSEPAAEGEEVLLAVEKFTFANSSIRLLSDEWGERTVKMPSIELSNLGSREKGLTPEQLAEAAIEPLLKQARRSVEKELKELAQDEVEDKLKEKLNDKLSDSQKEKVEGLKSLFGR